MLFRSWDSIPTSEWVKELPKGATKEQIIEHSWRNRFKVYKPPTIQEIRDLRIKKPKDFNDFSQKFRLNFSYDENNDYESNYKRLKKKFNKKYDVYLGFMDGNHRMCLFHHLLHNDALSDSLCVEEKSTKKNWTINHETSYIHEKYTLDLYCSTRKLPSTRMCRDLSYMIFRNQNESFHETHGDIFMEMINQYFSLKSIHRVDDLTEDKWRPKSKNNDKFEEVFKDVFMVPIGNLLCSKGLNIGRKCRKLTVH